MAGPANRKAASSRITNEKILAVILTFGVHLTTNAAAKDLLVLIDSLCVGSQGKADVVEKWCLPKEAKGSHSLLLMLIQLALKMVGGLFH